MVDYRNENPSPLVTVVKIWSSSCTALNPYRTQRELGITPTAGDCRRTRCARRPTLDGEICDRRRHHAVAFAETGHLCMAHAARQQHEPGARPHINFFPRSGAQLLMDLAH
jgi:Tfp pilus assembly ATPase PilU